MRTESDHAQLVEAFLRKHSAQRFFCYKLAANITEDECVDRQRRKAKTAKSNGTVYEPFTKNPPLDRYCRSGECKQGLVILSKRSRA